ncbi:MAG: PhnA domain-containing protein [Sulfurimonas sp.]
MDIEKILKDRSGEKCELCGRTEGLAVVEVEPSDGSAEQSILLCSTCQNLLENPMDNVNHWHCLNGTMWSQEPAVQAMAYRILGKISGEGWPQDMLDMLYLEPEVQEWAEAGMVEEKQPETRDFNGTLLSEGDSVSIIKDLPVKGAGFTAKQGTTVKNIRMVPDDPTHIQGRVNGTMIYLKTEFLKKL